MRVSSINLTVDERVVLNVGGQLFITLKTTLKNVPNTRLSCLDETDTNYDLQLKEYFYDRNPKYFSHIIDYYRTGTLHFSHNLCGPSIKSELDFWGIDENCIATCCWKSYKSYEDEKHSLEELQDLFKSKINTNLNHAHQFQKDEPIKKLKINDEHWFQKWSKWLWTFLDEPTSSKGAQVYILSSIKALI